eukprot:COSAG02_NODE_10150_length_2009_cov_1.042932_2_plen_114_part_01
MHKLVVHSWISAIHNQSNTSRVGGWKNNLVVTQKYRNSACFGPHSEQKCAMLCCMYCRANKIKRRITFGQAVLKWDIRFAVLELHPNSLEFRMNYYRNKEEWQARMPPKGSIPL